jgi:hypothetical protein
MNEFRGEQANTAFSLRAFGTECRRLRQKDKLADLPIGLTFLAASKAIRAKIHPPPRSRWHFDEGRSAIRCKRNCGTRYSNRGPVARAWSRGMAVLSHRGFGSFQHGCRLFRKQWIHLFRILRLSGNPVLILPPIPTVKLAARWSLSLV